MRTGALRRWDWHEMQLDVLFCLLVSVLTYIQNVFAFFLLVFQFSKGWSFGEKICETSKSHCLLKPYQFISEKVCCKCFH